MARSKIMAGKQDSTENQNGVVEGMDMNEEEEDFLSIDKELDSINSCLDALENQSASLQDKVKEFLADVKNKREDNSCNGDQLR